MTPTNSSLPSWLFSNNVANPKAESETTTMAKKATSTSKIASSAVAPPAELLNLVESFLERNAFKKALEALKKQRGGKETGAVPKGATLELVYTAWKSAESKPKVVTAKDDSSDSDSDSSDESSSSSSESEDDDTDMDEAPKVPSPAAGKQPLSLKRKAESSSDESSSDDDSSSSESDSDSSDDEPKAKKQKTVSAPPAKKKKDVSSDSDSSSGDSDSSSSDSSSESSSDESSDDSDSDSEVPAKVAAKVALPESDSGSSSSDDSSSDSDSDSSAPASKKKSLSKKDSSDSSATLEDPPLPPQPTAAERKKINEPFSRIPKDIQVDPRFASNAYIPMSYSQRAHEDLIVTKGKGFLKEKNKKKKGSFRGGAIDITEKKGVYFD